MSHRMPSLRVRFASFVLSRRQDDSDQACRAYHWSGTNRSFVVPAHAASATFTFFLIVLPILNMISGLQFGGRARQDRGNLSRRV